MEDIQRLEHLLRLMKGGMASQCLEAMETTPRKFVATRPGPIKEILGIYRFRAGRNTSKGSPIDGFDDLMPHLESWPYETVVVQALYLLDETFIIFTDAGYTQVAGILRSPQKMKREVLETTAAMTAA